MNKSKHLNFLVLSLYFCVSSILTTTTNANDQATNLYKLLKSKSSMNPSLVATSWVTMPTQIKRGRVRVEPQDGLMKADKITTLPGQPNGVDFDQYAGYVKVDPAANKTLFYYFAESPHNSSLKPLVLWLNGGPGCSSLGNGGLRELGPFRVKSDGRTLYRNPYAWNNVANVIFLESPAGVGFSYGDKSIIEETGDISTAKDAYTFLVNWLERFPQYKNCDFYITGESYAGHYVPQLAYTILHNNMKAKHSFINLKGIAIGNAWIDDATNWAGLADYLWTHAVFSDETHATIPSVCNFAKVNLSKECNDLIDKVVGEMGNIDIYNIYAPVCNTSDSPKARHIDSVEVYDPCYPNYVDTYLNIKEVQEALHAKPTEWVSCSQFQWHDTAFTVLPVIQELMKNNISVWIYSGDVDGRVPVTSSKYSINTLKLPVKTAWRPWYLDNQVGGYVVGYEGLVFMTVRGAGHMVPSDQPARALSMISSFLQGTLPPKSS